MDQAAGADAPLAPEDRLKQTSVVATQPPLPDGTQLGPLVPGLAQGAVPQGLAYLPAKDWFLLTLYRKQEPPGTFLTAVDAKTGQMTRCRLLLNPDGTRHTGHVGGVAIGENRVWIASGAVYTLPLPKVLEGELYDSTRLQFAFHAVCKASFVAFADGRVWVGEFVNSDSGKYPGCPKPKLLDHEKRPVTAWLAGHETAAIQVTRARGDGDQKLPPDVLLGIPEKTQGVAFHGDKIFLSASYGRQRKSSLFVTANPLIPTRSEPDARVRSESRQIPIWFLHRLPDNSWLPSGLPPMAEGITVRVDSLFMVYESAASPYRSTATMAIDRLVFLPLPKAR